MKGMDRRILAALIDLYGEQKSAFVCAQIQSLIDRYKTKISPSSHKGFSQEDAILITYGDQVQRAGEKPLQTLAAFCNKYLEASVSGIHILPFFLYSSDDGFSVMDYRQVNPALGNWTDIALLRKNFRLMFDAVINHVSAQGAWFQAFLKGNETYEDFFITVEGKEDLSQVVRPRTSPLLTEFSTTNGTKHVWTTFSADQVDLNYENPRVLVEMIDILLFYVTQGAEMIRLDAIAYLWKEIGTTCIHLKQTHQVIQLMRAVLDQTAPQVVLITETNVPHKDNMSYFGDGVHEAQMVYNFALPPLVFHTFLTGSSQAISNWVKNLKLPSDKVTFFNFLASHDGIGLNPVREILLPEEADHLVSESILHGGKVSYKQNPDGSRTPYELNINYFDALSNPYSDELLETQIDRFIAAHSILLALAGVPAIYFHSLFGSRNWLDGVEETGQNRSINREKLDADGLEQALADPVSLRFQVFERIKQLLQIRSTLPAFHPQAKQEVLDMGGKVFALLRISPDQKQKVLCIHNISDQNLDIQNDLEKLGIVNRRNLLDLQENNENPSLLTLKPYQVAWLETVSSANK
jgi:glucosylglycerate phosphorylase